MLRWGIMAVVTVLIVRVIGLPSEVMLGIECS